MSGLDKILEHISREARDEADRIIAEAREDSERLLSSGKAEADSMAQAIARQSETDVAAAVKRIQSTSQLKEKRIILQAKQEQIEGVFKNALSDLKALDDQAYFDVIRKMIARYATKEEGTIRFSAKDLSRLPEDLAKTAKENHLEISKEAADIAGGFILTYGDIEENCSFEVLIETSREALQDMVGQLLFG